MTEQHTFDWGERRGLALTVECPYCQAPEDQDCVGPDGKPLSAQPCHVVREVYASKQSGKPLLMAPEPPPDERPPSTARRGVVSKRRDTCNHCDAKLLWAMTRNDVAMPLDAEPSPDKGNVLVSEERGQLRADVVGKKSIAAAMRKAGKPLHLHHVVTCPFASRWRSRR
jgi:hypothetical protein